jgi:hypothetical protein
LRMQHMAQLVSTAADIALAASRNTELHLINIAGGPAADSINALLLLDERGALAGRIVVVHILDLESGGAVFGGCVLAALVESGAFSGAQVRIEHCPYDWTRPDGLADLCLGWRRNGAVLVAMSEGGLFEYGDDPAVRSNLAALSNGGVDFVAGSVTRADDLTMRALRQTIRFRLVPRGVERFTSLAATAGFRIVQVRSALTSDQVLLAPQHRRGGSPPSPPADLPAIAAEFPAVGAPAPTSEKPGRAERVPTAPDPGGAPVGPRDRPPPRSDRAVRAASGPPSESCDPSRAEWRRRRCLADAAC